MNKENRNQAEPENEENFAGEKKEGDAEKCPLTVGNETNCAKIVESVSPGKNVTSSLKSNCARNLTPIKEKKEMESGSFKTPEKNDSHKLRVNGENSSTPIKVQKEEENINEKEIAVNESNERKNNEKKTPEKNDECKVNGESLSTAIKVENLSEGKNSNEKKITVNESNKRERNENKMPEKLTTSINDNVNLEKVEVPSTDAEGGMLTEIEQAKLLMAASDEFLKSVQKTPVKRKEISCQSPNQFSMHSPGTPGRHKRVELITLASPKAKKLRQF